MGVCLALEDRASVKYTCTNQLLMTVPVTIPSEGGVDLFPGPGFCQIHKC